MIQFEQEAGQLFGEMREPTEYENRQIQKHLDEISEPTGLNLFDMIDQSGGEF